MDGDLEIKVIRAVVLFVVLVSFIMPAKGVSEQRQKGSFTAVFEEYSPLSDPKSLVSRMGSRANQSSNGKRAYDISEESFEVYVPDVYDSNTPFGLMVWISPSPEGGIEHFRGAQELMDKYKMISVGANNSGNKEHAYQRRVPLALDAAYNMQKLYNVAPNRVYVVGVSGGGRVASITAFHHSDVYNGGIFIIGANYWESMAVPGKKNTRWRSGGPRPRREYLARAKQFGRYVLLTGDNDGNRLQMHTYYEKKYRKILDNVLYIQVPGMGHAIPPIEEFEKALQYVDKPFSQEPEQGQTTNKSNEVKSRDRSLKDSNSAR